jgi:hypothetical protein
MEVRYNGAEPFPYKKSQTQKGNRPRIVIRQRPRLWNGER